MSVSLCQIYACLSKLSALVRATVSCQEDCLQFRGIIEPIFSLFLDCWQPFNFNTGTNNYEPEPNESVVFLISMPFYLQPCVIPVARTTVHVFLPTTACAQMGSLGSAVRQVSRTDSSKIREIQLN